MNEVEKKAVEFVKSELQDEKQARNDYQSLTGLYGNREIEIVLNLIDKQQKEIEELKEKNKELTDEYMIQKHLINPDFLNDYINKDKIKQILRSYEHVEANADSAMNLYCEIKKLL